MRMLLLGLLCAACTGTAYGQNPTSTQPAQPTAVVLAVQAGTTPTSAQIEQVSHGRIFGCSACESACGAKTCCETPMRTTCIAVPAVKKHVQINYSSVCEKVCFPTCGKLFGSKCDSGCAPGNCETKVYTQKYLVKKLCITECPTTKCVAVTVPACEAGQGGVIQAQPVVPRVETIPVKPMPLPKR